MFFSKKYIIRVKAREIADFTNILSDLNIKFHIGKEYIDYENDERWWLRDVTVRLNKNQFERLNAKANLMIVGCKFVD